MAWTTPRCWTTGEVVTAALLNAQIKGNMDLTAPAKLTAAGDMLYATGANATARLAKGTNGNILHQASCAPAWTATPSITSLTLSGDLTVSGGCIVLTGAATDVDLIDNNASALSFDASGKTGIIDIVTTNCSEGVKMSGTLTVGVDDTGADVKFFGAAAGAYMFWDESCNLLEVRGATAAGPGHVKLTTGETTVVACDVLGQIDFQAPAETGTDAITVAAKIAAVAQGTFAATVNATDLLFYTGHSEAATEKFRFTSQGEIGIGGANYGTDGQVLTSGGAGAAPAWEDAGGGAVSAVANGSDNRIATFSSSTALNGEANLTFDGAGLGVGGSGSTRGCILVSGTNATGDDGAGLNFDGLVLDYSANCHMMSAVGIGGAASDITYTIGCYTGTHAAGLAVTGTGMAKSGSANIAAAALIRLCTVPTIGTSNYAILGQCNAGQIAIGRGASCAPAYSFSADPNTGMWSPGADVIQFSTGSCTLGMRLDQGEMRVGADLGTANGKMGQGISLCQSSTDDQIFAMKSSDVAHSATDCSETDTYANFKKSYATAGGLLIETWLDSASDSGGTSNGASFQVQAMTHGVTSSSYGTSTKGNSHFKAVRSDGGSTIAAMTSGDAMVTFATSTTTRFAFEACGNGYSDAGTAWQTYDAYCDSALLRTMDITMAPGCIITSEFDQYVTYNEDALIEAGILGGRVHHPCGKLLGDDENRGLWNYTKHIQLLNGAAWQQHIKIEKLTQEVTSLKGQLQALTEGRE